MPYVYVDSLYVSDTVLSTSISIISFELNNHIKKFTKPILQLKKLRPWLKSCPRSQR